MDATEKEPAILKNSPKIPGYTILSRLGEGGMAVVYLAIQESFGRKVALKVMMPKSQDDPSYGERFLREAKIVARLSHPHIVPVYDVGSAGDYYYISMEYLDKGDLTSRLKNGLDIKGLRLQKFPEPVRVLSSYFTQKTQILQFVRQVRD